MFTRLRLVSRRARGSAAFGLLLSVLLSLAAPAADKNGASPNAITLPSGPGSIEGLGESFQPALNSGTMRYSIGLQLPPGTAGHTPALQFTYEGGQGNGPLGYGWSLPLACVQRQTDKGLPRYVDGPNGLDDDHDGVVDEADELDVFINDAKEELVPLANGDYFCKNEQEFIRYRRLSDHWEGVLPNGTRMEFGLTEAGRISDGTTNRVFKWLLERETDTHGNVILFSWQSFPGTTNTHQRYLQEIRYGPGAPPWNCFHFAAFTYEDRADWFEDCRSGFVVRTGKRLAAVTVGTQGATPPGHAVGDFNQDGSPDVLNRRYQLSYLDEDPGQPIWSLLSSITQVGADGVSTLPPARFGYSVCHPPATVALAGEGMGGTNEPPFVMDNANVELVDLNGDGLPDLLRTGAAGGAHVAYFNLGEQTNGAGRVIGWSPPQEFASADQQAWNVTLQSPTEVAHLADMNGDGRADLVYKSAIGDVFFFANRGVAGWGPRQFMSVQDNSPPAPFASANVRAADLDFDKRVDIIQSISSGGGADYRIWFNLGQQRYSHSVTVPQDSGFLFSLSGVFIADFNGDRVPDIVRLQPNGLTVTAGLGYGNFAPPVTVPLPDWTLDGTLIARARLEDITGDGLVDLVIERAAPGQVWYWINQGNYTLDTRRLITGLPAGLGTTTRWADLDGNGTTDLVFADSTSSPKLLAVDLGRLLGCVPAANTLTRIENGIGRVLRMEYAPSTRFALDDAAAGHAWTNPMPFAVTVVARVLTDDSLGHTYETQFRYHEGYYDAAEKQFRGFASAEQIETGDLEAPTLITRSEFDTGRAFTAMKGKLRRLTAARDDGGVFWQEETAWVPAPRVLYQGTNGEEVQFVHPTGRVKTVRELGQGVERRLESEFAYDSYGNQTLEANYGIVEDGDRSAFDDERIVTNTFALNLNAWNVRRPSRTEIRNEEGQVISRAENYYDDESFSGANFGEVQAGNLTLRREWSAPDDPGAFVAGQRHRYDVWGNPIAQLDPLAVAPGGTPDPAHGHFRELAYDACFHTFVTEETVRLGEGRPALVHHAEYDPGFGKMLGAGDANDQWTRCAYDAFARLQSILRPGDAAGFPSAEYDYVLAQAIGPGRLVNYVETRRLDRTPGTAVTKRDHFLISRRFTDGLGRAWMTKDEAEPAPGSAQPRVLIREATIFNARQKPARLLNPCFSSLAGSLDQLLAFEDIAGPGWHGAFHVNGELVSAGLPAAPQMAFGYDALLREIARTNADGTVTRTEFEPLRERRFDENDTTAGAPDEGTPTTVDQDGLGRQIRTEEWTRWNDDGTPSGTLRSWATAYAFDLNDQLVRVTDAQGNVKRMTFDGLKRLLAMNDPDRGVATYQYDAASNRTETKDAKGQRITYTYDGANRLLTEDYHDEGFPVSAGFTYDPIQPITATNRPDVAYFYDAPVAHLDLGNGQVDTARNTKGMLAYVWDLSGEEHHSYDARRREEWTVKRVRDPRHGRLVSYTLKQAFDPLDGVVQTTYPDNDAVACAFNERHLLRQIAGETAGALVADVDYTPGGEVRETTYGNGVLSTCGYDARGRMTVLRTGRASVPDQPYVAFGYDFDGVSNVRSIRDLRPAASVPGGSTRRNSQGFDYDDLHRLTRVRYGFGLPGEEGLTGGQIDYRYDRIGNLISQTSDLSVEERGRPLLKLGALSYGGALGASARDGRNTAEPGPHALSQFGTGTNAATLSYDANGNVTSKDGLTLTWDFKDRLVAAEDSHSRSVYVYDYQHRRIIRRTVQKDTGGTNGPGAGAAALAELTFYVSPLFEVRPAEAPVKYVWNGGTRVARISGSLSANVRVQRLRLAPGWNLVSLAVSAADVTGQLASAGPDAPTVNGAYRWDSGGQTFFQISPGEAAPAGTVLWLRATAAGTLSLRGTFTEPSSAPSLSAAGFVSWPAFAPLSTRSSFPADAAAWLFQADEKGWRVQLPAPSGGASGLPPKLAPGEVLFLRPSGPITLLPPDPLLSIRYYHGDHLGSASVVTDATGALVEETAYYPFGVPRHNEQPRQTSEPYQFTGKERDAESGLHYFEARYLAGDLGRFLSPDPAYAEPVQLEASRLRRLLDHPQDFNLYAHAHNNPLAYTDPTGYDPEPSTQEPLPNSVLPHGSVLPWKTPKDITVISGHGIDARADEIDIIKGELWYRKYGSWERPGYTVVPPGTTVTFYCWHGMTISDQLGTAIEQNKLLPEQFRVTYYPGDRIPNYTLTQPMTLHINKETPGVRVITVKQPTSLAQLLKPGMGAVHWAACRESLEGKAGWVDLLDPGQMPKH